jgi:hypothetical protein
MNDFAFYGAIVALLLIVTGSPGLAVIMMFIAWIAS